MTTKTRYFVIASLLVLGVGLGTGLVAYYVGFPAGAATRAGGPEELQYVPHDATVIAFANVQDVMNSQLRQKLLQALPMHEAGQKEFENQTGINIETDIDRIVASLNPDPSNSNTPWLAKFVAGFGLGPCGTQRTARSGCTISATKFHWPSFMPTVLSQPAGSGSPSQAYERFRPPSMSIFRPPAL